MFSPVLRQSVFGSISAATRRTDLASCRKVVLSDRGVRVRLRVGEPDRTAVERELNSVVVTTATSVSIVRSLELILRLSSMLSGR